MKCLKIVHYKYSQSRGHENWSATSDVVEWIITLLFQATDEMLVGNFGVAFLRSGSKSRGHPVREACLTSELRRESE